MKIKLLCAISIIFGCLFLKAVLERDGIGQRHLPKGLKPLDASYEANSLKRFSFGFDSFLSSLLWVQVLQKSDHRPLGSDEVSWEFAQIDAITTLDPRFYHGYSYGSIFLSVLRRDKLGGKLILEKWANRYPTYWRPVHMLGMHHYEELGDYQTAAPLILRAANMKNAPHWLNSLGLRLLSDSGSLINAITTAIEISKITHDPVKLKFLSRRIRSLNFNLQKKNFEQKMKQGNTTAPREIASLVAESKEEIPIAIQVLLQERFKFGWNRHEKKAFALDTDLERTLGKTGVFAEPSAVQRRQ